MRRLSWIVTLPLLIVAVVFAVTNRHAVPVRLWPLQVELELPLYLLVLVALAVGLLAGALIGWIGAGGARRRAREARARADALARELEQVRHDRALARPEPSRSETGETAPRRPLRLVGGNQT